MLVLLNVRYMPELSFSISKLWKIRNINGADIRLITPFLVNIDNNRRKTYKTKRVLIPICFDQLIAEEIAKM